MTSIANTMVHVLHEGRPLCGFSRQVPAEWPTRHRWIRVDEMEYHLLRDSLRVIAELPMPVQKNEAQESLLRSLWALAEKEGCLHEELCRECAYAGRSLVMAGR